MKHLSNNAIKTLSVFVFLLLGSGISQAKQTVKVMTYNVENLFDTEHDEGKSDWAYLPLRAKNDPKVQAECHKISNSHWRQECLELDWSPLVKRNKVLNLSQVIKSSFGGQGPDILVLEEVENRKALESLRDEGLSGMGYTTLVFIEGPDLRGIDTAILSRYPLFASKDHHVNLPSQGSSPHPTRNILEATFKVGSKHLTVFANHWPSQGNPTSHRIAAANTLVKAAFDANKRGDFVVALGDFNSVVEEIQGEIGQIIRGENGKLAFVDGIEARLDREANFPPTRRPGSHWYRGSWGFLDRILVFQNSLNKGLAIDWKNLDVHAPDFAMDGPKPFRFNAKTMDGFSDHLPLVLNFDL